MLMTFTKEELLNQNKKNNKLNVKKTKEYFRTVEKETNFAKWTKNNDITITEGKGYTDIDIYNVFSIRYMDERFLGFYGAEQRIYDLIENPDQLSEFLGDFENFIQRLNVDLDIQYNTAKNLDKTLWLNEFYLTLKQDLENVFLSLKNSSFYIPDCNVTIKLQSSVDKDYVDVSDLGNRIITIKMNNFSMESLDKLDKLLDEKKLLTRLKSISLAGIFSKIELDENDLNNMFNDSFGYSYYDSKKRIIKEIEKNVPGSLVRTIFTTVPMRAELYLSYFKFEVDYFKCDFGYYMYDFYNKSVIYTKTRQEIIDHCVEQIGKNQIQVELTKIIR
ncbi:hypothetical protein MZM54_02985 [[Brevibacterium] frigoritolerans]|nr:hypothetical protein [Peribacillus frigoritolerans]